MEYLDNILFICLAAGAFGYFGWNLKVIWQRLHRGQGKEEKRTDKLGTRIKEVLLFGFGQQKMFKDMTAGLMHALIFWGFLIVSVGTFETLLYGSFGIDFGTFLGEGMPFQIYLRSQDLGNLIVAVGIIFAVARRKFMPPKRLESLPAASKKDAYIVLSFILALVSTALMSMGARAHAALLPEGPLPVARAVATMLNPMGADWKVFDTTVWWMHCLVLFSFTTFLPFSKHQHLIWVWPNILFRSHKGRGRIRPMEFDESAESFGASKVEDFPLNSFQISVRARDLRRLIYLSS